MRNVALPFKSFVGLSSISTYILLEYKPDLLLFSRPSFLGTFSVILLFLVVSWLVFTVILYPKFFSHLRHLPGPTGETWWRGHTTITATEVSGGPMIDW